MQKDHIMSDPLPDLFVYSPENLIAQADAAPDRLGYKLVRFYLSPSGGTLRDTELNIVLYSAKFDIYKGLGRPS